MALALRRSTHPHRRALVLPAASAREAALVDGLRIHGAAHLLDVVASLLPSDGTEPPALPLAVAEAVTAILDGPDLREVKGQSVAKRALEIAAAGGHSVLMLGSPGTGKSMLAQRFVGLLPPMTADDALESAAVLSLTGAFTLARWGQRRCARRTTRHRRSHWSGAARRRGRARSRWRTTAFSSSTSSPSSSALRSKPCGSRWRPAAS
jgi:magnesium chelatase family protein